MKLTMAKQTTKISGEAQEHSINIISEKTLIKGDISASGDIRIDGELVGNINAKGRLVIGPKGKVEGEINCNIIEVSGYIKGKVTALELLTMKSTSKIDGDIISGKLSVEPGSLFTGTCSMENANTKNETPKPKGQKQI
jgi:cytoskeletal protein CcmA (bactofilin family)